LHIHGRRVAITGLSTIRRIRGRSAGDCRIDDASVGSSLLARRAAPFAAAVAALVLSNAFDIQHVAASGTLATTTSVTITSSANPSGYGQILLLNAMVQPSSGTTVPTGTVTFKDGATTLGSVTLDSHGQAALSESTLQPGTHSITAAYAGSTQFAASTSGVLQQVITVQGTTTMIFSSVPSAAYGESVLFFVTVSANAGTATPAGTVRLSDGGTVFASPALDATGEAVAATSSLAAGVHTITASYLGNADFSVSSASLSETITKATTTLALSSSGNPAPVGSAVTLTAAVAPASGSGAGGVVTFFDGGSTLGSVAVGADSTARLTTAALAVGSHSVTASYGGDANYTGSSAAALTQVISRLSTTTTLASSANPSAFGAPLTLTASVASAGSIPTGSVTFSEGSATLGSAPLDAAGHASLSTGTLSVGSHAITAAYGGDGSNAGSASATLTQAVVAAGTTASLTSSANPIAYGTGISLTATVTSSAGTATGSVTFSDGSAALGSAPLDPTGHATLAVGVLEVGNHALTAAYSGDSGHSASTSPALSETVMTAPSGTGVTTSASPSVVGQQVTFTATVTASAAAPTGTVTFRDGGTSLGSAALDASGHAGLSTASLAAGTHTITAAYSGDGHLAPSSATVPQVVTLAATSTSLSSSPNPAAVGDAVTVVAHVTSASGTPTGSVTFNDAGTGLGSAPLDATGTASLTLPALSVGSHPLTAVYGGDGSGFASSQSGIVDESITARPTQTTLSSSPDPATVGDSVTFSAAVTSAAGPATGAVTFSDDGTALATVTLDGAGHATFTTSALGAGDHTVSAIFGGSTDFSGSQSPALTETVNRAAASLTLTSSGNPSTFGQAVTLSITAAGPAGTPSGTVGLSDGSTPLGSVSLTAGTATLQLSGLTGGVHVITAAYTGDGVYGPAAATLEQHVSGAATATTLAVSATALTHGQTLTLAVHVTSAAGAPGGTVMVLDGTTTVASASLEGAGAATMSTVLGDGTHTLTATYSGTAEFDPSTSGSVIVVVSPSSTSTCDERDVDHTVGHRAGSDWDTDLGHGNPADEDRDAASTHRKDCTRGHGEHDNNGLHLGENGTPAAGGTPPQRGQDDTASGATPSGSPSPIAGGSPKPVAGGTPAPSGAPPSSGGPSPTATPTPPPTSVPTPTPAPPTATPAPTPSPTPAPHCGGDDHSDSNHTCHKGGG
jgi:hypothetical protein